MLVVKVEVWPGGERGKHLAYTIAEARIGNTDDHLGETGNYTAKVETYNAPSLTLPKDMRTMKQVVKVRNHPRAMPVWHLILKVLKQACAKDLREGK